MVTAYCESPKITEESFLIREFGIKTVYVNSTEDFLKKLEISGGITLDTIKPYLIQGIHCISVGALTHHATSVDISLKIV